MTPLCGTTPCIGARHQKHHPFYLHADVAARFLCLCSSHLLSSHFLFLLLLPALTQLRPGVTSSKLILPPRSPHYGRRFRFYRDKTSASFSSLVCSNRTKRGRCCILSRKRTKHKLVSNTKPLPLPMLPVVCSFGSIYVRSVFRGSSCLGSQLKAGGGIPIFVGIYLGFFLRSTVPAAVFSAFIPFHVCAASVSFHVCLHIIFHFFDNNTLAVKSRKSPRSRMLKNGVSLRPRVLRCINELVKAIGRRLLGDSIRQDHRTKGDQPTINPRTKTTRMTLVGWDNLDGCYFVALYGLRRGKKRGGAQTNTLWSRFCASSRRAE